MQTQMYVTLKAITQKWFNGLPSNSITYFQELCDHFVSPFIADHKERRMSIHLSKIK